jgi:hypothetical protein
MKKIKSMCEDPRNDVFGCTRLMLVIVYEDGSNAEMPMEMFIENYNKDVDRFIKLNIFARQMNKYRQIYKDRVISLKEMLDHE